MILRKYPESISLFQKNFIVHFSTLQSEHANHVSPLSIKCSMKGLENYKTSDGNYEVTTGNYLIVNEGQQCESYIENEAETFSIYFDKNFANETLTSLVNPSDKMLNFSFIPGSQPVQFLEKLYSHNHTLSPVLMKLRLASKVGYDDENWLKEQFVELMEKLLIVHRNLYKEIEKLPPVKLSTKTELYKRVCRAKEFIDSSFTKDLTLEIISKEACLSQYHFLRLFKSVFKKTPHQYLTEKRISKAMSLLFSTDMSITQICFEIGFESISSFSWLFRKKFGLSPEMMRENYRKYMVKHKFLELPSIKRKFELEFFCIRMIGLPIGALGEDKE
ncbi:MAG: AraC family transcriptional regulator [Bacteroidota bacterium]|nr:AraC family transcriptional regulator [Bacteroidota bacterium]